MKAQLSAEVRRFVNTCIWSRDGWTAAWSSEKSLRFWALANAASAALTFAFTMTPGERALILTLGILILAAELMNTAIEEVVDVILPHPDPRAKKAKDCGSAAVGATAIAAGLGWVMVLIP